MGLGGMWPWLGAVFHDKLFINRYSTSWERGENENLLEYILNHRMLFYRRELQTCFSYILNHKNTFSAH